MILFLYGNDSYRLLERVKFLKEAFKAKYDEAGHNLAQIDAENFSIDDFRKKIFTAGLFSSKRFVVFNNPGDLSKEEQTALLEELKKIDADTILCVVSENFSDKNNTLFKRLKQSDKVEEYNQLTPVQLNSYIQKKCKALGATITKDALNYLVATLGSDLWHLTYELKKISHFSPAITIDTVKEFISPALDENIFHLTDALGNRDVAQALKLLEDQFSLGANPQYLITMLSRQMEIIVKVKKTEGRGLKLHPYVLAKAQQQAKKFTAAQLKKISWQLLEIDHYLKTHSLDPRLLLDLLCVEN